MSTKALLVFQGGGAMGAYQCGAYKAISAHLRRAGLPVAGIAGASIGAVNAAMVARHLAGADGGADALERLWREDLATQALPILPFPGWYHHCWNGLLSMLLKGNPGMSRPNYLAWGPWGTAARSRLALHDPRPLARLLERRLGSFGPNPGAYPLLLVRAVNATTRQAAIFHSWRDTLTPRHLVASSSVPVLYPLAEIDGEAYWDGDILPFSPLRELLHALRGQPGGHEPRPDTYLVIIVDTICGEPRRPGSALDLLFQVQAGLLAPRADADEHYAALNNRYLDFLADCADAGGKAPSGLAGRIRREREAARAEGLCRLDIVRIRRPEALPFEYVSRDLDYSRERVALLIEQGERHARAVLEAHAPAR